MTYKPENISYKIHAKLKAHRRQAMGPKISRWQAFMWKYNANQSLRDLVDFSILTALACITFLAIFVITLIIKEP